jgi:hypothetical protein
MTEPSAPNPPAAPAATAPRPVPPRILLLDSLVCFGVVAVCTWQRNRFLDIADNWLLALSLFLPVGNLVSGVLSLRAYGLRAAALQYRMALGALLTLYYGYLLLHVTGLSESPLGTLLVNAAGSSEHVKVYTGLGLGALLLLTFLATDACQRTAAALRPAETPPAPEPAPPAPRTNRDAATVPY